jgi:hypothetical protein
VGNVVELVLSPFLGPPAGVPNKDVCVGAGSVEVVDFAGPPGRVSVCVD